MKLSFTPDTKLAEAAAALSEQCRAWLERHFDLKINHTDASIATVEVFLAEFHRGLEKEAPTAEKIQHYASLFGSFIGETFRRNHGATWGADGDGTPAMKADRSGIVFYPWVRAWKRITMGEEENVAPYYAALVEENRKGSATPPPLPGTRAMPPPLPGSRATPPPLPPSGGDGDEATARFLNKLASLIPGCADMAPEDVPMLEKAIMAVKLQFAEGWAALHQTMKQCEVICLGDASQVEGITNIQHPSGYRAMAVFTSEARVRELFVQQDAAPAPMVKMHFLEILQKAHAKLGIVVNPLHRATSFDVSPEEVSWLLQQLRS